MACCLAEEYTSAASSHMRLDEKIIFYDVNSATPTFHHTAQHSQIHGMASRNHIASSSER
jgi:hypothetical protein